jgi:hypothetical protein
MLEYIKAWIHPFNLARMYITSVLCYMATKMWAIWPDHVKVYEELSNTRNSCLSGLLPKVSEACQNVMFPPFKPHLTAGFAVLSDRQAYTFSVDVPYVYARVKASWWLTFFLACFFLFGAWRLSAIFKLPKRVPKDTQQEYAIKPKTQ